MLLLCFGTIATAETYSYAGSDGDWQGQLTLTVNSDGSALLNGASVVGGTIESIAPGSETYGDFAGHYVSQELVLTGSQGYAGTGVVDGSGNSAGTQVSFTNGENVVVVQEAQIYSTLFPPDVPYVSSEPYGGPSVGYRASALQWVGTGEGNKFGPLGDSHFETILASTSAHNADGSSAGVSAQAVATNGGDATSFLVLQQAETLGVWPVFLGGSYGGARYGSTTTAYQGGEIENISSATIQAYATNTQVSTTGSLFVSEGNLSFKEVATTRQGINFAASEYGTTSTPANVALLEAVGMMEGKSGGSSVVSTFSNGDLATVTTSFLVTNGSRANYPALDFNLIGLAASNSSADLVWARTNITNELYTVPFGVPAVNGDESLIISTASHNSVGDSQHQEVTTPLNSPLDFIGAGTGIFRTADNTRHWQRQWHSI